MPQPLVLLGSPALRHCSPGLCPRSLRKRLLTQLATWLSKLSRPAVACSESKSKGQPLSLHISPFLRLVSFCTGDPGSPAHLAPALPRSPPGRNFVRRVGGGLCGGRGAADDAEGVVGFVSEITKQQFSILTTAPVALGILTGNLSHRCLCLKPSRVLSEFSKAQVNSVPANGLSGEAEIAMGRASRSLPGPEASMPSLCDVPAEPLPAQASPATQDGHRQQEPPAPAPGTLGLQQSGTAHAGPSGSASAQPPASPVREAARAEGQGSGQQKPPEDDGAARSLGVSSPTSPVSVHAFQGAALGKRLRAGAGYLRLLTPSGLCLLLISPSCLLASVSQALCQSLPIGVSCHLTSTPWRSFSSDCRLCS